MNREVTIQAFRDVDIEQDGWVEQLLDAIENRFAAGYLSRVVCELNESFAYSSEDFRDGLLDAAHHDIWT